MLSAADQLILQFHYCDDLTCDSLVHIFGTTRRAIHVRLHRARKRFLVAFQGQIARFPNDSMNGTTHPSGTRFRCKQF